jgi:murein DD-endopeptidase MepM/ murein hydrolase activator NlpD
MGAVAISRRRRDNSAMTAISVSPLRAVVSLIAVLSVAACGWAEWPPQAKGPRTSAPAPRGTPAPAAKVPVFVGADAVIVGKGDSVHSLALRHGVSARAIIEANYLLPPYVLKPGRRIVLPRSRTHTVVRGDTLSRLARTYGTDTFVLARTNRIGPPYTIYAGQQLVIPSVGATVAPTLKAPAASKSPTVSVKKAPPPRQPAPRTVTRKPPPPTAVPKPPFASGGFIWPVKGGRVISAFGTKTKGLQNDGINIAAPRGSTVRAAQNGVVTYSGNELRGFGNLVLIKHSGGWITAYAHNGTVLVKRGGKVRKGQKIATVGSTGSVSTPQLHFELRKGKRPIDPRKHLRG